MKRLILIALLILFVSSGCSKPDLNIKENMVLVEGGEFLLGKEGETSHLIRVRLDDYYISKYETTVEQWERFLYETDSPYEWKGEYHDMRDESPYPDSPIGVKWIFAIEYANWVSRKYGLEECYIVEGDNVEWKRKANGYRLPTDAEWEFAARGGNISKGYQYSGSNDLDDVAWNGWNSDNHTHPVGTKKANELGLFDMSGNIDEWCWDLSLKYPNDPSEVLSNPVGPTLDEYLKVKNKRYRIARGGAARSSELFFFTPYDRAGLFEFGADTGPGIRLARNAE